MDSIKSVLKLEKLVFDKLEFNRTGFKNTNQVKYSLEINIAQNSDNAVYRVTLTLKAQKEDEYSFIVKLSGFFSFDNNMTVEEKEAEELINKNAVAILMPYLRSQVTLLTAQPEVDCVVLPPFNILSLMKEENKTKGEKKETES